MTYVVFARKWRPQDFDEIVGQGHITATLKNAIRLHRISQAYLFAGPHGIGKTSTARILAKALNCAQGPAPAPCNACVSCVEITGSRSLDVIEIDGASNRGIDEIRNLRENVKFAPAAARFKIYIIDEVHQITDPAFNALLKTLEEPPPHVKFIFATTHPHKVPATILSRCQRFDFKKIPASLIVKKLQEIANAERIDAPESVFFEIAKAADGSLRDAESILDQLNSFCEAKIGLDDVSKVLGIIDEESVMHMTALIARKDLPAILELVNTLAGEGKDLFQYAARMIEHVRNLAFLKINRNLASSLILSDETAARLTSQGEQFSLEELIYFFYVLVHTYEAAKRTALMRFLFEFALIRIVQRQGAIPIDELLEKVRALEAAGAAPQASRHDRAVKPQGPPPPPPPADDMPAPAAVDSGAGSLADIKAAWGAIVSALSQKKASLAAFLGEGEPTACVSGVVTVALPKVYQLHKDVLEKPDNRKLVEDIMSHIVHTRMKIEFILGENQPQQRPPDSMPGAQDAQKEKEGGGDPVIQDALDVFKGTVIKTHKGFTTHA